MLSLFNPETAAQKKTHIFPPNEILTQYISSNLRDCQLQFAIHIRRKISTIKAENLIDDTHIQLSHQTATSLLKGNLKVNPLDRERAGKLAYLQLDTTGKEKNIILQNHSQHSCRVYRRSSHHPCDSENQTVLM